jgi:hypothetical protein
MEGEDSLYAFVIYDSADGESFVGASAFAGNNCAGEYLDALLVAFFDYAVHIYGIPYFEIWELFFQAFSFNCIQ